MANIAIIVAGGEGLRVDNPIPKQYIKLKGKPIIQYSIEKFVNHSQIDVVLLVLNKNHSKYFKPLLEEFGLDYCYGGEIRSISVQNGIEKALDLSANKVLIHDAARPFITEAIINEVLDKLDEFDAVDLGVAVNDTIKMQGSDMVSLLDRRKLYATQTPQGFKYKAIQKLFADRRTDYTCEISMALASGVDIGVAKGSAENLKITNPIDLKLAELMLEI